MSLYAVACVWQSEASARISLNSAFAVERVFWAALSKVFRKASLSLINKSHDWQSLLRPISSRISSHLATRMKD